MQVLRLLRIEKVMKSFIAKMQRIQRTQIAAEDNNAIFFFVSLTPVSACLCVLRASAVKGSGSPHPTFGHQ